MLTSIENKACQLEFGDYIIYTLSSKVSESFICLLPKKNCLIQGDSMELSFDDVIYMSKKAGYEDLYKEYRAILEYLIKTDGQFIENDYFKYLKIIQERSITSKNHSKKASSQAITYAEINDFKGVKDMLEEGADVNYQKISIGTFKGYSILDFAIYHGHTDVVNELLDRGATLTSEASWSKSYLIRKDTDLLIRKIIEKKDVLKHNLKAMIHVVYQNRDYDVLEDLLCVKDYSFDEDLLNTILSHSIKAKKAPITTKLLELGFLPNKADICFAIKEGLTMFVSKLLKEIEYPVKSDRDMMMSAAESIRGAEMIDILLEMGDYGTTLNIEGKSALSVSAELGRPEAFNLLAKQFPDDIDVENKSGYTPFTTSIKRNYPDMIKEVLLFYKDINGVNKKGETPLCIAALNSTKEVMQLLIDEGADPNNKNDKGTTPLTTLALTKEIEAIQTLLDNGGDPTMKNNNGLDALAASILQKYDVPSIVELLLKNGCDANSVVEIAGEKLTIKELATNKNKHQSLIVLNKPEYNS